MGRSRRRAGGGVSGEVAAEETEARRRELRRGGADIARKEFTSMTLGTGLARTGTNTGTQREPPSDSHEGGEARFWKHFGRDAIVGTVVVVSRPLLCGGGVPSSHPSVGMFPFFLLIKICSGFLSVRGACGIILFPVYVALTYVPEGELLTGFAMRSDPNVVFG